MASIRIRNGKYQFIVKNKKLLPKPLHFTFDDKADGQAYVAELEACLAKGIVPKQFLASKDSVKLHELIDNYVKVVHVTHDNRLLLDIHKKRLANIELEKITYKWTESWVKDMKQTYKLAPSTIKKHVGSLARCLDWGIRHDYIQNNPLRLLQRGYATYTDDDIKKAGIKRIDIERDRRLELGEEDKIISVISGQYQPVNKRKKLVITHPEACLTFFYLAIESAMRMREMYTLEFGQIDFAKRTIFLDETKNGDKRQVPITGPLQTILKEYFSNKPESKYVFPWFDGKYTEEALKKTTANISKQWDKIFKYAECEDLRFHDLRHEATSRIYERTNLTDLEVAKITGHRNLKTLQRYANLRGSNLAERLW